MESAPIIKTERLILRPWRDSDLESFALINSHPEVMEFIPIPISKEESDAHVRDYQEEWKQRHYGRWALELPGVEGCIGYVGLHYTDFKSDFTPCVEIGWRLAREHWGKGYATEAAKAAIDYGFNEAKLKELYAFTFKGNTNSRKLMERLGMVYDPELDFENPTLPEGHPMGSYVVYRLRS